MAHRRALLWVGALGLTLLVFLRTDLTAYGLYVGNGSPTSTAANQPVPTPSPIASSQPASHQDLAATAVISPAVYVLPAPVAELQQLWHAQEQKKSSPIVANFTPTAGYETILFEGFEGSFPYPGWTMFDLSNDGFERLWDDVNTRAHTGGWSGWPARGGAHGLDPNTTFYADNMDSWMVYGPFDLSNAVSANTSFARWIATEECCDYVSFLVSRDGINFDEYGRWNGSADWTTYAYGLDAYLGDDTVWLAWWFYSDGSVNEAGPFIDDILIEKYVEPCANTNGAYTCVKAVASTLEWQETPLVMQQDEEFTVTYLGGDWTVGVYHWPYTGPAGYSPAIDNQINSACKTVNSLPYAMLLGRVGNGTPFAVGEGDTFIADTNGSLALRINDEGGCMNDNRGAVIVGLEKPTGYTLSIITHGNGTVSSNPAQPAYTHGQTVRLTAVPAPGWTFANWDDGLSGNSNPAELIMDDNKSVTVNPVRYNRFHCGSGSACRFRLSLFWQHNRRYCR